MRRFWIISAGLLLIAPAVMGAEAASRPGSDGFPLPQLPSPTATGAALQWLALVTVLAIAPAVLVMVTCFTRIIVVLGLLRQALASPQLPPNQVLFGLALLMTAVVMVPVYRDVHREAISPYISGQVSATTAWQAGEKHLRGFMIRQVEACGNGSDVYPFLEAELAGRKNLAWSDVPTISLIPAYVVSELKTAFVIGFRIYLPFVIIDMLVASVLMSMGMLMLPPVLISMPFKLLLFVLADGWRLVVATLMKSFG